MAFRTIVGQERAIRFLQQALESTRLAHAYLFYGPNGTGKKLTALQFTKALYCSTLVIDACDTCVACRKVATGNHPDLLMRHLDGSAVGIDDIRTIQHRLSYRPYEHHRTTIILDGCETLTLPAANALLKTLEEPPESALIILLTCKKDALPLTILSRCQLVPFRPLPPSHIQIILERHGVDSATANIAAALAEGSLETYTPADCATMLVNRHTAYTLLQEVVQSKGISIFNQARQLAGRRAQCEALLHWLTLLCRDLVMLHVAPSVPLYNHDLRSELFLLTQRLSVERLLDTYTLIEKLRQYLTMNINSQLIFEHLLVYFQQILASAALSGIRRDASFT